MLYPTPREAQMIEAIANTLIHANTQTHSELSLMDSVARNLRSLARGGGEVKFKQYDTKNFSTITPSFCLCTEHPCKKRDEEIVDMFKSGGKLEYASEKPEREMPKVGEPTLWLNLNNDRRFEVIELRWGSTLADRRDWEGGLQFLLSERALAKKKCAELNEILRR